MVCFERMSRIMDILTKRKIISTFQLEALMYCSTSTLRRDLIKLEKTKERLYDLMAKFDLLLQTILNTLTTAEAMKKLRENNKLQKRPPLS